MTNPNDPAMPTFEEFRARKENETIGHYHGLTKRELFAIHMAEAILSGKMATVVETKENVVILACELADALIIQLNKPTGDK